jgi:hypothetical protein
VIVVAVVKTGWDLLGDAMRVLLDASLDAETLKRIRNVINAQAVVAEWLVAQKIDVVLSCEDVSRKGPTCVLREAGVKATAKLRPAVYDRVSGCSAISRNAWVFHSRNSYD